MKQDKDQEKTQNKTGDAKDNTVKTENNENFVLQFDSKVFTDGSIIAAYVLKNNGKYINRDIFNISISKINCIVNQYSALIESLSETIQKIKGYIGYRDLYIEHQNQVLIEWLKKGNCAYDYQDLFDKLKQILRSLHGNIYVGYISANKNEAKKLCSTKFKQTNVGYKSNFTKVNLDNEIGCANNDNFEDKVKEQESESANNKKENRNNNQMNKQKKVVNLSDYL